jgi:GntR family transcriptional regulator, transcriptional repressor for pyruvate dehydrogenase complex
MKSLKFGAAGELGVITQIREKTGNSRTLASKVGERLRLSILGGEYAIGDRLPNETQLAEAHGVSRTVVREAVAALRSDGLVEVRQGAGTFVLSPSANARPVPGLDQARLHSDLEVLEIRTPLEIEAAGLAALRRSPAQEEQIFERHTDVMRCIEMGQSIRDADFALHLAIAEATSNPLFVEFLQARGSGSIPQSKVVHEGSKEEENAYRRLIHEEHRKIVIAISNRDEDAARTAMRDHLKGSQIRYRKLLHEDRARMLGT